MPGSRISQAHGTVRPVDPSTGASSALVFAMYHPAAALRTPDIERTSYDDVASIPAALLESRARRVATAADASSTAAATAPPPDAVILAARPPDVAPDATLF
jgi:hypothetical protein